MLEGYTAVRKKSYGEKNRFHDNVFVNGERDNLTALIFMSVLNSHNYHGDLHLPIISPGTDLHTSAENYELYFFL